MRRFRTLLSALRFDDVLALLFTSALLLLTSVYSVRLEHKSLVYFLIAIAYYLCVFLAVRALVRSSRVSILHKRVALWALAVVVAWFTIVAPDETGLENIKNGVLLLLPIVMAWWLTPGPGDETSRDAGIESVPTLMRDFGPFLVSQAAYLLLHDVVHTVNPVDRDEWLIQADQILFGGHWTVWLEPFVHPLAVEWFSATYSMFLFFPLALALCFVARNERPSLRHLLQAVVLCNYLGYIGYLLVPAIGPMYTLSYEVPLSGGWFFQVKDSLDSLARVPRDCFPSLHTANTFVVIWAAWKYARGLAWIFIPLGASCIGATIYLRYHYTVDVFAGFLLGGAVVYAVPYLERGWRRLLEPRASQPG